MVAHLVKDGTEILANLDPEKCDLMHSVLGLAGEVGELVDAVKKHTIYGKDLDLENVVEELGDLEFFMEQFRQNLSISRSDTLQANIKKLAKRYPDFKFTNQRAIDRADKKGGAL